MRSPRRLPGAFLCFCAFLTALSIVLGKYLALNVTPFVRISLENLPILMAGFWLGPSAGVAVGVTADLLGCVLVGYSINPIITLGAAAVGLVSGLAGRKGKKSPWSLAGGVALAHLLGSVLIKTVGLTVFFSLPLGITLFWRLATYLPVGAAETALLLIVSRSRGCQRELEKISYLPR